MTRPAHGFTVEQDMDTVHLTTPMGAKFILSHDQAVNLIDDLIYAAGDAAHWLPYEHVEERTDLEDQWPDQWTVDVP